MFGVINMFGIMPTNPLHEEVAKKTLKKLLGISEPEPPVSKKIKTIFTDTKTEGKKTGYARAAEEYNSAYRSIEQEYQKYKQFLKEKKDQYNSQAVSFIDELESLQKTKEQLEAEVEKAKRKCASENSISISDLNKRLSINSGFAPTASDMFSLIDLLYNVKERQRLKAEKEGYIEAKAVFEEKLDSLQKELKALKVKGNKELNEFIDLLNDLMTDIAKERAKLAELKAMM